MNIVKHGFSFAEILEVFDDPAFLEGYDDEHSGEEERYYGIGCLNNVLFITVFYTERRERTRIISARQADADEQEAYNDYFKKINF
ncbi:MAG: BrnT family toxin [Treponema sp.]|nr:BrnT family toxin [Treponema sp.]